MTTLTLRKIGNSIGVILPKEVLSRLNVEEPKWLSSQAIRSIQDILIARTGGIAGILNPFLFFLRLG